MLGLAVLVGFLGLAVVGLAYLLGFQLGTRSSQTPLDAVQCMGADASHELDDLTRSAFIRMAERVKKIQHGDE